jgi:hypothetical protein
MHSRLSRLTALILALCVFQLACYNKYSISTEQLETLSSGNIAEVVTVQSSEGDVFVRASTPVEIRTTQGNFSITPFNFSLGEQQLVAPDYDLLINRSEITDARVSEFSKGRTIALAVGSVVAAGAAFALVSLLAGSESE